MPTAQTRPMARQIATFAVVGVVNTGLYYGLYLLLLTRLPYLLAHVLAFLLSMVGSFFLNARFTYRTRPTWRKFLLFPLTNAANFAITTAGVYVIVDVLRAGSRFAPAGLRGGDPGDLRGLPLDHAAARGEGARARNGKGVRRGGRPPVTAARTGPDLTA